MGSEMCIRDSNNNNVYVDKTELKMQDAIYVFEFKVDGTPEEALKQINSKGYAIPYQPDHRKVMKVGVNFDSATGTIGEWRAMEVNKKLNNSSHETQTIATITIHVRYICGGMGTEIRSSFFYC
mgnify:CR=1 FL=1